MSRNLQQDTSEMNVIFVHSAVDDYPLTPEEFRVYAHLARRAGLGEAWPKVDSIAQVCRMHPDTARRCLQALTAYGMLKAEERKGRTTLYTITRASNWKAAAQVEALQKVAADAGKVRRDAAKAKLAARKEEEEAGAKEVAPSEGKQADPSVTKGGVVNEGRGSERREATPSERREGYPSVTKGDEVNPFEVPPLKEGVSNVTNNPRASLGSEGTPAAQAETQASQDDPAPRSSSESAALETSVAPAPALTTVALLERPAAAPTADAADSLALTEEDLDELLGAGDVDGKAPEQVPAGAAAAPAGLSVETLRPVPREDLLSRDVAPVDSEAYRAIRALFGKYKFEEMLGELTATGGYSREDWLRLSLEEIAQAREAARTEAQAQGGRMVTFAARALDRLIGAVVSQKPQQQALQANGAAYVLRTRIEPEPEAPSEGKYEPGALYRPKAGGAEVELVGLEVVKSKITGGGARYRLSDGQVLPMLELIGGFEFVGRANAPA